jgi:hypothetical protein
MERLDGLNLRDIVKWRNPEFIKLADEDVQMVLAVSDSESRCLTLAMLEKLGTANNSQLNTEFDSLYEASTVDCKLSFSSSYYSEICKQFVKNCIASQEPGDRRLGKPHTYAPNRLATELVLPWCGNLLSWSSTHNINLKDFLGEPRVTKPGEISGNLVLLSLFAKLTGGPVSVEELFKQVGQIYGPDRSDTLKGRSIGKLIAHKATQQEADTIFLKPEFKDAIEEFLVMLDKMAKLDPDFFQQGKEKIRAIIEDPTHVTMLMRRVEFKSNKKPDVKRNYQNLATPLIEKLQDQGGAIRMDQINQDLFPRMNEEELRRFRRLIRMGKLSGISIFETATQKASNDTSHILVVTDPIYDF